MTKNRIYDLFPVAMLIMTIAAATTIAQAQNFSVLYNFGTKSGDPYNPQNAGVVARGRDGNLYTTAPRGGTSGSGTVFKITPGGTLTVVYSFDGAHGETPYGGLTLGTDGNFYGTTYYGGASNHGTVFKVTPSGSLTLLYSFTNGTDGAFPSAPPIQGADGNFYGTTAQYIDGGPGSLYKITRSGKFTTLYTFDVTHGSEPYAPLVQGTDGNFYGTTNIGGAHGFGEVFKVTPEGKLSVLYNFDLTHGAYPYCPLVQGSDGDFYGTTYDGGSHNGGVVFKITATGKFTVLHNINNSTDGARPNAGLVQATDGNFYGVNSSGGTANDGTIFKLSPTNAYKVLYDFDGTEGATPLVTLFQHTNGVLYGDTEIGGTGSVNPCTVGQCGVFYSWNLGLKPFVSLVSTFGKVGQTVEILGQGFTGTKGVSFNGTTAIFKVSSDTYLTATVPNGATSGSVTVGTPGGTLTSNKTFRVTPQIISFKPTSGPVGTPVMITGVSLTQTTKVTFGGVKATSFTVNSDTQVKATVPTGAKTGHIAITTAGGTAASQGIFTVTQ
jgi:uncharacterized repeat protein (TIGR03803 family)